MDDEQEFQWHQDCIVATEMEALEDYVGLFERFDRPLSFLPRPYDQQREEQHDV